MTRPIAFLDRDGVLNEQEPGHYVTNWSKFRWIPGIKESIRRLNELGFLVIVVTNQGGIAYGHCTEQDVEFIHFRMNCELAELRARIDGFFYCPHHPNGTIPKYSVSCTCRKPRPGLIKQAIGRFGPSSIDFSHSFMVGDNETDIQAGRAAGIRSYKYTGREFVEALSTLLWIIDYNPASGMINPGW